MPQIQAVKTPLTPPQALGVLASALGPSRAVALPMVAAQSASETDHWRSMWNWSFGNVTTANPSKDTFHTLGKNGLFYKSFDSPENGASEYIDALQRRGILDCALRRDMGCYAAKIAASHYLGFIGRVAPDGKLVTQQQYDTYASNIAGLVRHFESMTPESLQRAQAPTPKKRSVMLVLSLALGAVALLSGGGGDR